MASELVQVARQKRQFRNVINARRVLVADIMADDPQLTHKQIRDRLADQYAVDVSLGTVQTDIKQLKSALWYRSDRSMEYARQQLLKAYQDIYKEAMKAWSKSLADAYVLEETSYPIITKEGIEISTRKTERLSGQSGNPALLDKALDALSRIEKLFGFDEGALSVTINQTQNTQNNLVVLPAKDDGGVLPFEDEDDPPLIIDDNRNGKY